MASTPLDLLDAFWQKLAVELCDSAEDGQATLVIGSEGYEVAVGDFTTPWLVMCDCSNYGYPSDWELEISPEFEPLSPNAAKIIGTEFNLRVDQRSEEVYRNTGRGR